MANLLTTMQFPMPIRDQANANMSYPLLSGYNYFMDLQNSGVNIDSYVRLYRANYLVSNVNIPETHDQVRYNIQSILDTLVVPYNSTFKFTINLLS